MCPVRRTGHPRYVRGDGDPLRKDGTISGSGRAWGEILGTAVEVPSTITGSFSGHSDVPLPTTTDAQVTISSYDPETGAWSGTGERSYANLVPGLSVIGLIVPALVLPGFGAHFVLGRRTLQTA